MLVLLWIASIALLLAPIVIMLSIVTKDKKGRYINRKRTDKIETYEMWVVVCIILSSIWVIYFIVNCYNYGFDQYNMPQGLYWMPGMVIWFLLAIILFIYPLFYLRKTRLEGKELNMWEHLNSRKEVLFPWEYNPVATNLATVYLICSMIAIAIGLYFFSLYYDLDDLRIVVLVVGFLVIGGYVGYLLLRPARK